MTGSLATESISIEQLASGALWRVKLAKPKGNVLTAAMVAELTRTFEAARSEPGLHAVLLAAEGPHFSYGASVEEHQPEQVADMLAGFHELFRTIARTNLPVLASVRGACLGGGLELAAFCHRIFASPSAQLGQPEIKLGVIAPVATAILTERMGRGAAEDLLLSGRSIDAQAALATGLVDELAEEPDAAALAWAEEHLLPHSASSLRFATRAARLEFNERFDTLIARLERLYLDELMESADAVEGINAFLAKREPEWSNR